MFLQANIENRLAAITIKCWQALWTAPMFGLSSNPNLAQAFQAFLYHVPQLAQHWAEPSGLCRRRLRQQQQGQGRLQRQRCLMARAHAHAH